VVFNIWARGGNNLVTTHFELRFTGLKDFWDYDVVVINPV